MPSITDEDLTAKITDALTKKYTGKQLVKAITAAINLVDLTREPEDSPDCIDMTDDFPVYQHEIPKLTVPHFSPKAAAHNLAQITLDLVMQKWVTGHPDRLEKVSKMISLVLQEINAKKYFSLQNARRADLSKLVYDGICGKYKLAKLPHYLPVGPKEVVMEKKPLYIVNVIPARTLESSTSLMSVLLSEAAVVDIMKDEKASVSMHKDLAGWLLDELWHVFLKVPAWKLMGWEESTADWADQVLAEMLLNVFDPTIRALWAALIGEKVLTHTLRDVAWYVDAAKYQGVPIAIHAEPLTKEQKKVFEEWSADLIAQLTVRNPPAFPFVVSNELPTIKFTPGSWLLQVYLEFLYTQVKMPAHACALAKARGDSQEVIRQLNKKFFNPIAVMQVINAHNNNGRKKVKPYEGRLFAYDAFGNIVMVREIPKATPDASTGSETAPNTVLGAKRTIDAIYPPISSGAASSEAVTETLDQKFMRFLAEQAQGTAYATIAGPRTAVQQPPAIPTPLVPQSMVQPVPNTALDSADIIAAYQLLQQLRGNRR